MRNKALCFLCSILALGAPSSWADENTLSGVNVGELAQIQSQTILLNAKAEKAKAERSIKGEDQSATTQPSTVFFSQGNLTQPAAASAHSSDTQSDLPVVKAVFGSAKRLRATLLYSSGFEVDADASSRELPGGYRVAILSVENVTLERDGKRYPLGFSSTPPASLSNVNNSAPSITPSAPMPPGLIPGQR